MQKLKKVYICHHKTDGCAPQLRFPVTLSEGVCSVQYYYLKGNDAMLQTQSLKKIRLYCIISK